MISCHGFAQSEDKNFLRVTVSLDQGQSSAVLVGRILGDQLTLINEDLTTREIQLKVGAISPGKLEFSKSTVLDIKRPALQFALVDKDTQVCAQKKEFKTFLESIELLRANVAEFEVTSSNTKYNACATEIASVLLSKGFRTSLTTGKLDSGGVSVRSYVQGDRPVSDEIKGYRLYLSEIGKKDETMILPTQDGFFIRSFLPSNVQNKKFHLRIVSPKGENFQYDISGLPVLKLGDSKQTLFSAEHTQVMSGRWDHIALMAIPQSFIQAAIDEEKRKMDRNRFFWKYWVSAIQGSGSGFSKRESLMPVGLGARIRVSEGTYATFEGLAPVNTNADYPETTILHADFNFWLMGKESLELADHQGFSMAVSMGGFYYMARPKGTADSPFLLSDLLSVDGGLKLFFGVTERNILYAEALYAPTPGSQGTDFSLSSRTKVGYEHCLNFQNCISLEYLNHDYNVDYKTLGKFSAQLTETRLGFRRSF